jgi:hypothetical protein
MHFRSQWAEGENIAPEEDKEELPEILMSEIFYISTNDREFNAKFIKYLTSRPARGKLHALVPKSVTCYKSVVFSTKRPLSIVKFVK